MTKRKVAAITGKGTFTVVEEDIPEPREGEVLVEVKASLISPGTELMGIKELREKPKDSPPRKFGYSSAGIVKVQGPGCEDIPVGTRVACMGGKYAEHSDINRIPRNLMVAIPEGIGFEEAAFAHLGATALHGIRRSGLQYGEHFGVIGLGILGQLAVQMGNHSGTHVMGMDMLPARVELAGKNGAELVMNPGELDEDVIGKQVREYSRGYGLDCALFAFGGDITDALTMVTKLMKVSPDGHAMGRIVIMGAATFTSGLWPVAMGNIDVRASSRPGAGYHDDAYEHGREYPRVFVPWTNVRNMEEVLRMAAAGKLDLQSLITHRLTLDTFAEGTEVLVRNPNEALGIIINY